MSWQLQIHDPSGEVRKFPLTGTHILGRGEHADIPLRDPTASPRAGSLFSVKESPDHFWFKVADDSPPARLGDLQIREANIPCGVQFKIGETRLSIQSRRTENPIPAWPTGVRPWLSQAESGRRLLWNAKKAAETSLSVYLAGETGTGKEVLAHLLHAWSPRKSGPFVPLHCGALSLSLVESELFGHVKGAFTGAFQHRPGALMQAHGGTLFLDEIGDLPLDIQVKLLRFLENGEIRSVGADRTHKADVRLICATHHPLHKLVEEGKFRRDLFYRLASVTLQIPSLRSRPEDIELLAHHFANHHQKKLSNPSLLRLQAHCWPGNVRELQHTIERACGLSGSLEPVLGEDAFAFLLQEENPMQKSDLEIGPSILSLKEMERFAILRALRLAKGNRAKAAIILGVARSTLFEMIKRHKIMGPRESAF
jgi:transcriptional regulator with PAS, ATPase and Fis domain